MTASELRELRAYDRWARERLLAVAETLSPEAFSRSLPSSHGSVRGTLLHLLWADWIWTRRLLGLSPRIVFDPDEYPDVAHLRARWREVDAELDGFLAGVDDAACERPVSYRNTGGQAFEVPLGVVLQHVVNHGTYHRGQVVTLLRALGCTELPSTDLRLFWSERHA